jgi:class 3 adenylate cyclase
VRRLAVVDWFLIGILLPILLFGIVMSIVHGVHGEFVFPPFLVSSAPSARAYPIVREVYPSSSVDAGSIAVGDIVQRLNGLDLRGYTTAGVALRWTAAARAGARSLSVVTERGGALSEVEVALIPGAFFPLVPWWAPLSLAIALAVTALLLLIRAARWRLARRAYLECMLMAFAYTPYFSVPTMPRVAIMTTVGALPLVGGLILWTVAELVPGAEQWGPRLAALIWTLCLLLAASFAAMFWVPDVRIGAVLVRSGGFAATGLLVTILAVLTRTYRRSNALGRRQIKWIIYGSYVGVLPAAAFYAAYSLGIGREWLGILASVATIGIAACPLGLLVAIAFDNFLDIDRLFGATLSYSLLAICGLALVLGVLPSVARAASDALGLDPTSGQLILSVGLAAVLVPIQRVVRPRIDRALFPERITLQQGFDELLAELSGCKDMQELTRVVGDRLDALLRPTSTVLYVGTGNAFTPLAVRGRPAPPVFAVQSGLIATLRERTAPIAAERWSRHETALGPFERAAIETLDVAVLVPIRRGADLVAFSCLGPKRSGDIYTPTDLALLGAVASKVSDRLLALDATAMASEARAMQEALRRFVPGAVAEHIVAGRDLAPGEREVTVLFVDIRGYTGFSEPRAAEEIFRTVNRYTETVSNLVQARGGVVVEFHGDGMLAIFGAPEPLPKKESAAVQAARDIVATTAELPAPGADAPLSVGVGIATGTGFVGNIQAADRAIWTVIGNTVNLAARLQSLTRDLDAAVAIDDATFRRASAYCTDFVRYSDFPIRGRALTETVHALPLAARSIRAADDTLADGDGRTAAPE